MNTILANSPSTVNGEDRAWSLMLWAGDGCVEVVRNTNSACRVGFEVVAVCVYMFFLFQSMYLYAVKQLPSISDDQLMLKNIS